MRTVWRPTNVLALSAPGGGTVYEEVTNFDAAARGVITTVQGTYYSVSGQGVLTLFINGQPLFQFLTQQVSTPAVIVSVPLWLPVDSGQEVTWLYETALNTDVANVVATGWTIPPD